MAEESLPHWTVAPERLWQYATESDNAHQPRIQLDRACLRLTYERPQLSGYDFDRTTGNFYRRSGQQAFYEMGPSLTREVTGAAAANLCRQLQVKVQPSGADYELLGKCESASMAANGILEGSKYLVLTKQRAVMDALHCCVGAVKVYLDRATKELRIGRVDPLTLRWDRNQGAELFDILEIQAAPRRRLLAEWADNAKACALIKAAPAWQQPTIPGVEPPMTGKRSDTIKLVEAFSAKIGKEKGLHAWAVEGGLLDEPEDYDEEILPYAFARYEWDFRGFEGVSLARIIGPYDIRNRRLSWMMDEAIKGCLPIVWEHVNEFAFEGLDDTAYQRGTYHGASPPEITIAGKTSPDVEREREQNRQRAYAEGGISYEMGRGTLPPGLKSAPSINAYSETVSLRQLNQQQRIEQLDADVGELICRFGGGTKAALQSKGTDYLTEVEFPDLSKNKFRVTVLAGSALPRTLSGRIAAVESIVSLRPDLSPEQRGRMMDIPDVDALNNEQLAQRRLAEKIAGNALKNAEWPEYGISNDPKLLAELLPLARAWMASAQDKGTYPPENLACLHRVIRVTESMVTPPPAPEPVAPPVAPLMDPMAAAPMGQPLMPLETATPLMEPPLI